MDEMDVYDPLGFILEITPYGYIAQGWRTYNNKDLNNFWIKYQRLEKVLLECKNAGLFGDYYHVAQELYYQIGSDFRKAMKESGNL